VCLSALSSEPIACTKEEGQEGSSSFLSFKEEGQEGSSSFLRGQEGSSSFFVRAGKLLHREETHLETFFWIKISSYPKQLKKNPLVLSEQARASSWARAGQFQYRGEREIKLNSTKRTNLLESVVTP
jgi:hypothetical protein